MATATTRNTTGTAKWNERVSRYFRSVLVELKKVHWPNRPELVTYTGVVLGSVLIVALLIWIMDSIFSLLLGFVL